MSRDFENMDENNDLFDIVCNKVRDDLCLENEEVAKTLKTKLSKPSTVNTIQNFRSIPERLWEYKKNTLGAKAAQLEKKYRETIGN